MKKILFFLVAYLITMSSWAQVETTVAVDMRKNTARVDNFEVSLEDQLYAECSETSFTTIEPCDPPSNITATVDEAWVFDGIWVHVDWTGTANTYNLRWREASAETWYSTEHQQWPVTIPMSPWSEYLIQVQSVCDSSVSEWMPERPITVTSPSILQVVTATAHGEGIIEPDGVMQYVIGATPTYTFTPNEGFIVQSLQVSGEEVAFENNEYQFPYITHDQTIDVYFIEDNTNISENSLQDVIKLYPNPATTNITLSSEIPIQKIEILDMAGRVVTKLEAAKNTFNISHLEHGIYFTRIVTSSNGVVVLPFVKQ